MNCRSLFSNKISTMSNSISNLNMISLLFAFAFDFLFLSFRVLSNNVLTETPDLSLNTALMFLYIYFPSKNYSQHFRDISDNHLSSIGSLPFKSLTYLYSHFFENTSQIVLLFFPFFRDLCYNRLTSLPDSIPKMTSLASLYSFDVPITFSL